MSMSGVLPFVLVQKRLPSLFLGLNRWTSCSSIHLGRSLCCLCRDCLPSAMYWSECSSLRGPCERFVSIFVAGGVLSGPPKTKQSAKHKSPDPPNPRPPQSRRATLPSSSLSTRSPRPSQGPSRRTVQSSSRAATGSPRVFHLWLCVGLVRWLGRGIAVRWSGTGSAAERGRRRAPGSVARIACRWPKTS